ncbi:hypothetical protein BDW62DRAFT_57355 [Aspergillus aurantiobrunneus]
MCFQIPPSVPRHDRKTGEGKTGLWHSSVQGRFVRSFPIGHLHIIASGHDESQAQVTAPPGDLIVERVCFPFAVSQPQALSPPMKLSVGCSVFDLRQMDRKARPHLGGCDVNLVDRGSTSQPFYLALVSPWTVSRAFLRLSSFLNSPHPSKGPPLDR